MEAASAKWHNWCRLCAKENIAKSRQVNASELLNIMEKHFQIKVNRSMQLPTSLCEDCNEFLKLWMKFVDRAIEVQNMYEELWTKYNTMSPDKDVRLDNVKDEQIEEVPVEAIDSLNLELERGEHIDESSDLEDPLEEDESESENEQSTEQFEFGDPCLEYCEECGRGFKEDKHLRIHKTRKHKINRHPVDKVVHPKKKRNENTIFLLHCGDCGRGYNRRRDLAIHMKTKHQKELPNLVCAVCDSEFRTEHQLQEHEKRQHMPRRPEEKTIPCNYCNKLFAKKYQVELHIDRVHLNKRPFVCEQCGFAAKGGTDLREHLITHFDDRPVICEICNMGFKSKDRLRRHLAKHSTVGVICPVCGKTLKSRYTLSSHMHSHREDKPHKCVICGRSFKAGPTLKNHLYIHLEVKPYSCVFCEKGYPTWVAAKQHQKVHHEESLKEYTAAGKSTLVRHESPTFEQIKAMAIVAKQNAKVKDVVDSAVDSTEEDDYNEFLE